MAFKSGFVNIVGNPNVGKSTLMNLLVGERISIITSKSQTTRHRIMGIVTDEESQIVFSDTPGVLKPHYKLQQSMRSFSNDALVDADILVYVTDVVENNEKNADYIERVNVLKDIPKLVLINKIDLTNEKQLVELVGQWKKLIPGAEIYPVSAKFRFNVDNVLKRIKELLPETPPYFEKDQLTDRPLRFFVSEIVREKILLYYDKEIPYSTEVVVDSYKESKDLVHIEATVFVEHESQKGIIIGHQGVALKKISMESRKSLEKFLDKKVFLRIFVKVNKDWRNSDKYLGAFGYIVPSDN